MSSSNSPYPPQYPSYPPPNHLPPLQQPSPSYPPYNPNHASPIPPIVPQGQYGYQQSPSQQHFTGTGTYAQSPQSSFNQSSINYDTQASRTRSMTTISDSVPTTKMELRVSCSHLPNLDVLSKSDPQVFLFIRRKASSRNSSWQLFGKTEIIRDNLNPSFSTAFVMDYYFEQVQQLCFIVVDVDDERKTDLKHQDYIGCCQVTLGELAASSRTKAFEASLALSLPPELSHLVKSPNFSSTSSRIKIVAEELGSCRQSLNLVLSAKNVDKKDKRLFGLLGGSSDPFYEIQRSREDPTTPWVTVYRSETVRQNLNPLWKQTTLNMGALVNGDIHRSMKIRVLDFDNDGGHDFIGECIVSVNDLIQASRDKRGFPLINEKKKKKRPQKYIHSGEIFVQICQIVEEPSFVDYIATGTEIALSIGIDFTGSNGNPQHPSSLHYQAPPIQQQLPNGNFIYDSPPNQYQTAILSVGSVLQAYDTDKKFPLFGFGLRVRTTGQVYHCYPLTGNMADPEVHGIDGVLAAYKQVFDSGAMELYGPTNFAPLIQTVNQKIQAEMNMNQSSKLSLDRYHILLIMTDGLITDMDATIEALVESSVLPLSIVIVGVGNEDFTAMNVLDGDGMLLKDRRGRIAERDCVQFVPLNQFPPSNQMEALAKETLAEIPTQFLSWVKKRYIKPK